MMLMRNTFHWASGSTYQTLSTPGDSGLEEDQHLLTGETAEGVGREQDEQTDEDLERNEFDEDNGYDYEEDGVISRGGGGSKSKQKGKSGHGIYSSRHVRGQIERLAKAAAPTKKKEGKRLLN